MRSLPRTPRTSDPERVLPMALPVGFAVAVYGLSYGVLAVAAGLQPWLATASSLIVLAGGSQFAFVAVIAAGGSPFAGAVSGLLLNLRYLPFGLAVAPHLPHARLPRRLLDAYLIVDESVAVGLSGTSRDRARRFRIAGWTVVIAWVGATALGAYGGQFLGDPQRWGLDAAFPAGFLALLAPWLRTRAGQVSAVAGVALALALTPVAPPGVPILAAGLGALLGMRVAAGHAAGNEPAEGPTLAVNDGQEVSR